MNPEGSALGFPFDRAWGCVTDDGSRNPKQPPGMVLKPVVNNGINYQPQLVDAGFLNHQQYDGVFFLFAVGVSHAMLGYIWQYLSQSSNILQGLPP